MGLKRTQRHLNDLKKVREEKTIVCLQVIIENRAHHVNSNGIELESEMPSLDI